MTDADQVFTAVSDDLAGLLGYAAAELVGRPTDEILISPNGDRLEQARRRIRKQRVMSDVATLKHRDGRPIRYAYTMQALHSNGVACYVTIGRPLGDGAQAPAEAEMPSVVTKAEAALIARVSVKTIERWINSGLLPAGGGRGSRRIELARLRALLAGDLVLLILDTLA